VNKKVIIILITLLVFIGIFYFELTQYLTLQYFQQNLKEFHLYYAQNPKTALVLFFFSYIFVIATSLPSGATLLSLLAGALFGLPVAVLLVSFGSSIGATIVFFIARFLLRDWVQSKFKNKLTAINKGIQDQGNLYLATLRLTPIFPFFMINLLMGLTPIKASNYYWVSQLSMLPGTIIYINAGTELGKLQSLKGIFSPGIIISFILVALFPHVVKWVLKVFKISEKFSH
jgi:uncharacterized membrane protein YdjX (TVP38/TMEM64 family)